MSMHPKNMFFTSVSVAEGHRVQHSATRGPMIGLGKYLSLGVVYELDDYKTPSDDVVKHLQSIIDEAFGRTGE